MLHGLEKIHGCSNQVHALSAFIADHFDRTNVWITSGKRFGDPGQHGKGLAVDIVVENVTPIKVIARVLEYIDIYHVRGIGVDVYRNMAHFDFREQDQITWWTYDREGHAI